MFKHHDTIVHFIKGKQKASTSTVTRLTRRVGHVEGRLTNHLIIYR